MCTVFLLSVFKRERRGERVRETENEKKGKRGREEREKGRERERGETFHHYINLDCISIMLYFITCALIVVLNCGLYCS